MEKKENVTKIPDNSTSLVTSSEQKPVDGDAGQTAGENDVSIQFVEKNSEEKHLNKQTTSGKRIRNANISLLKQDIFSSTLCFFISCLRKY